MPFYLQIDGIDGEVSIPPYVHWIEVMSYALGDAVLVLFDGGSGASGISSNEASLRITLDKSYPRLQLAITSGAHLKSAKLVLTEGTGAPYFSIYMGDVVVSHLAVVESSSRKSSAQEVKLTLSFKTVEKLDGHAAWSTKAGKGAGANQ